MSKMAQNMLSIYPQRQQCLIGLVGQVKSIRDLGFLVLNSFGSFSFLLKNYEKILISKNMHKRDKI